MWINENILRAWAVVVLVLCCISGYKNAKSVLHNEKDVKGFVWRRTVMQFQTNELPKPAIKTPDFTLVFRHKRSLL